MNTFMLQHPTVSANLATLRARGVDVVEPDWGLLACGDEGAGRMPDALVLVERVKQHFVPRDLEGKSVLHVAPEGEPLRLAVPVLRRPGSINPAARTGSSPGV